MGLLRVFLLGRVDVSGDAGRPHTIPARKAQELLAQLLLSRDGYLPRETLADRLWPEHEGTRGRKYLRQTIWQLQAALDEVAPGGAAGFLRVEPEWISMVPGAPIWTDVAAIEDAFALASSPPALDEPRRRRVEEAVALYRGEYLSGIYAEWAVFERERLRAIYLHLLDLLVVECQRAGEYERGIGYANDALRCERADERMHRHLMSMLYRSGDRTAALRQYSRCLEILREELDVEPSAATLSLLDEIRWEGELSRDAPAPFVLDHLLEIQSTLRTVAKMLDRDISSMQEHH